MWCTVYLSCDVQYIELKLMQPNIKSTAIILHHEVYKVQLLLIRVMVILEVTVVIDLNCNVFIGGHTPLLICIFEYFFKKRKRSVSLQIFPLSGSVGPDMFTATRSNV